MAFTRYNYDDLRTNSSASASLKKQKGKFSEIAGDYSLSYAAHESRHQFHQVEQGLCIGSDPFR